MSKAQKLLNKFESSFKSDDRFESNPNTLQFSLDGRLGDLGDHMDFADLARALNSVDPSLKVTNIDSRYDSDEGKTIVEIDFSGSKADKNKIQNFLETGNYETKHESEKIQDLINSSKEKSEGYIGEKYHSKDGFNLLDGSYVYIVSADANAIVPESNYQDRSKANKFMKDLAEKYLKDYEFSIGNEGYDDSSIYIFNIEENEVDNLKSIVNTMKNDVPAPTKNYVEEYGFSESLTLGKSLIKNKTHHYYTKV